MNEVNKNEFKTILKDYDKEEINKANKLLDEYSDEINRKEEEKTEEIYKQLKKDVSPSIDIVGIMKKSIAENAEVKYERDKKFKKIKTIAYMKTVAFILACVAALAVAVPVYKEISYHGDAKEVVMQVSMDAGLKLSQSGLSVVPDPASKEWRNDYSKVVDLNEDDLYGMFKYLGTSESEKVVKELGYTGWDNYLSMHGYFDKDGNPSIIVYDNMMESKLVEEYREGKENGKGY